MSLMEQGIALLRAGRFHEALQQFGQALREHRWQWNRVSAWPRPARA